MWLVSPCQLSALSDHSCKYLWTHDWVLYLAFHNSYLGEGSGGMKVREKSWRCVLFPFTDFVFNLSGSLLNILCQIFALSRGISRYMRVLDCFLISQWVCQFRLTKSLAIWKQPLLNSPLPQNFFCFTPSCGHVGEILKM